MWENWKEVKEKWQSWLKLWKTVLQKTDSKWAYYTWGEHWVMVRCMSCVVGVGLGELPRGIKSHSFSQKGWHPWFGVCYRKSTVVQVVHVVQVGCGFFSNCKGLPVTILRHRFWGPGNVIIAFPHTPRYQTIIWDHPERPLQAFQSNLTWPKSWGILVAPKGYRLPPFC